MTQSLLEQIEAQERLVKLAKDKLSEEQATLSNLTSKRADCNHVFNKAVLNYEHEGGYCTKCGVNELYAYYLKSKK